MLSRAARVLRALDGVSASRILARTRHEVMQRLLPRFSPEVRASLLGVYGAGYPEVRQEYLRGLVVALPSDWHLDLVAAPTVEVRFLNDVASVMLPVDWVQSDRQRLWRFQLHYFSWAVERLEMAMELPSTASCVAHEIGCLMEDWINGNPIYQFDGWHPYTTSLRIVSWTYLLTAFPALATVGIRASLWQQIRYLKKHPERHAGGSHLFENLRALIIGASYFVGKEADDIVLWAVRALERELEVQVLGDGCHFELSTSYHLQITSSLGEAVASMLARGMPIPDSLRVSLERMVSFARAMRLESGKYPHWNDSAYDAARDLDEIVGFCEALIHWLRDAAMSEVDSRVGPLYRRLLDSVQFDPAPKEVVHWPVDRRPERLAKLGSSPPASDSGYAMLRGGRLEVAFDAAPFGAPGLSGHGHADCLNVDVFVDGRPLIVETGTSTYEPGPTRTFERGTAAHNSVEIDDQNQSEVWGAFRVGRKARPINVDRGCTDLWTWASGGHDGYDRSPHWTKHHRWVGVSSTDVVIVDQLRTTSNIRFVIRFHTAPGIVVVQDGPSFVLSEDGSAYKLTILGLTEGDRLKLLTPDGAQSWHSPTLGTRLPRSTIEAHGTLSAGDRTLCTVIGPVEVNYAFKCTGASATLHEAQPTPSNVGVSAPAQVLRDDAPIVARWSIRQAVPELVSSSA